MTDLNILGIFIISAPLLLFAAATWHFEGAKVCMMAWGGAVAITGFVCLGSYLVML